MKHVIEISPSQQQDIHISVVEDSSILLFGAHGGTLHLHLDIQKQDVSAHINGVIIGTHDASFEISTICRHSAPSASSRFLLKTVLTDASTLAFDGMIRIEKDAQLSDAYLKNENLLLGTDARANSSPQLEILADDVKASHGVSISTIDAEDLYYLVSRGIEPYCAKRMLVAGFLSDVLAELDAPQKENLLSSIQV